MKADSFDMKALEARLAPMGDAKYRDFSLALIPGVSLPALGVRVPALRALGRELLRGNWRAFLEASRSYPLFEARMLHAIVLGSARCDAAEKLGLAEAFLPFVDNWCVCDALCSSWHPRQEEREAMFDRLIECAASGEEYVKRFGLVMLMSHYRDEAHVDRVLEAYRGFRHPGYYARMGAAWGLATLYLARPDGVRAILQEGLLDDFTHNKTLQKLRESYRVPEADKRALKALRRPVGKRSAWANEDE